MRTYSVYQTMYLGTVEVPDNIEEDEVIGYMERNDCWPTKYLEPIGTDVREVAK